MKRFPKTALVFVFAMALIAIGCARPTSGPAPTTPPSKDASSHDGPDHEESTPSAKGDPEAVADAEHADGVEPEREAGSTTSEAQDGTGEEAAGKDEKEKKEDEPGRVILDTEYDDADAGADQAALVESEMGLVEDEALNRYVRSVALRLLRYAPKRPFDYEFRIVDQTVPNAFALPGGKIYVSRGLLAMATSEDELAGVLGHEITHAAERHASARLEYSKRINPLAIGLIRAARIAEYGRDQELDADRGGQIMAAKAGYDPRGIAAFLRKLDAAERYEIGWSRIPWFLATHPTSPQRSAVANDRASSLEWERKPGVAGDRPEDYFAKVDGLIIGDDPAGGVFDDENWFIHPELRFAIRFPQNWETMNSAQAVRAVSPRRDAQAELSLAGSGDEPLEEIVERFLEEDFDGMSIRVNERKRVKLGDLEAIRIDGRAASPVGGLALNMTFVRYGDLVYRLSMLSIPNGTNRYRAEARAFAHSFRALDDEEAHSLLVTRLRIARAREGETLQDLSIRTRNALEVVFTGILNGRYATTPLAARTAVKIGIEEPYVPRADTSAEGTTEAQAMKGTNARHDTEEADAASERTAEGDGRG